MRAHPYTLLIVPQMNANPTTADALIIGLANIGKVFGKTREPAFLDKCPAHSKYATWGIYVT